MGARVKKWHIPCSDTVHLIEFTHDPITERRSIKVDDNYIKQDIYRNVKDEPFTVNNLKCCISIKPKNRLEHEYTLSLNGKPWEIYVANWKSMTRRWQISLDGRPIRLVFGKIILTTYHVTRASITCMSSERVR